MESGDFYNKDQSDSISTHKNESQNIIISMLTKLGTASWLLPFLGDFEKWELFMNSLWSDTKIFWDKNYKAFKGLEDHLNEGTRIFIKLLKDLGIDKEATFDENYNLCLNLVRHGKEFGSFLEQLRKKEVQNKNYSFRRLNIDVLSRLNEVGIDDLNRYFKTCSPISLQILNIDGGMIKMSKIMDGFPTLLRAVKKQVHIYGFDIRMIEFKQIIENSCSSESLRFINCGIIRDSISFSSLEFDESINYKIAKLDFFSTLGQGATDKMEINDLKNLMKLLKCTKMIDSLKEVHIKKIDDFEEEDIRNYFEKIEFKVELICNVNYYGPLS